MTTIQLPIQTEQKLLALSVIARNNPEELDRCLASCYSVFDEIVVVDTGHPGDKPLDVITTRYKAKYIKFPWVDDFAIAKNTGLRACTAKWILWLDSDDIIKPQELVKLFKFKKEELPTSEYNSYVMPYNYGHDQFGHPVSDHARHRIIKNLPKNRWEYPIHEILVFDKFNFKKLDICVDHEREHHEYAGERNYKLLKTAYEGRFKKDGRIAHYYARECFYKSQHEEVVRVYSQRLYDVPDYTRLGSYYYYAKSCIKVGKDALGIKLCLEAISKSKGIFAEFYCILGEYYLNKGYYTEAKLWYEKALGMEKPKDTWEVFMDDNCYNKPYIEHQVNKTKSLITQHPDHPKVKTSVVNKPTISVPKVGRNDNCPCGSGKKYKKCCGSSNEPSLVATEVEDVQPTVVGTPKIDTIFLLPLHASASSREWLPKFLPSYMATEAKDLIRLHILSNGDDVWTAEIYKMLETLPHNDNVKVVPMGSNLGWIKGLNLAVGKILDTEPEGQIQNIGFMNSDVTFQSGWCSTILHSINQKGVGATGFTHRKYNLLGKTQIGWIEFCCVLFKFKALAYVSSIVRDKNIVDTTCLDTRFGMGYFDDDDLCLRLLLNGWQLTANPPLIEHHVRSSTPDFVKKISSNYPVFVEKYKAHESQFVQDYLTEQCKFFEKFCPWVISGQM